MSDPIPDPRNDNHHGNRSGSSPPGAPRWLKVSGIVVAVVVVVAVIVSLATGTEHGPGLHESWVAVLLGRNHHGRGIGPSRSHRWF